MRLQLEGQVDIGGGSVPTHGIRTSVRPEIGKKLD